MKIAIVTRNPYPIGMAATNRIISYSKELVQLGHIVKIFCLRPTEIKSKGINNIKIKSDYKGIEYTYTSGTTLWPESGKKKLVKAYLYIKGLFNFIRIFIKDHKQKKYDILFLQIFDLYSCKLIIKLCRKLHVKIVSERSEFHDVRFKKFKNNNKKRKKYIKNVFKKFDGMILMTRTLQKYYKKFTNKNCKTIIVPMTVDISRFDIRKTKKNYIAYCGNLNSKKDGVDILIKAYAKFSKKFPNIKLKLIGGGAEKEVSQFKKLVFNLNIKNNVDFEGYIKSTKIPEYLMNAKSLVLARPSSIQAEGGFPTKLGEYLATANPVVVTKVGEIPYYLKDRENAFLASPDSVEAIKNKLLYIFKNYDKACKIGKRGKEIVEDIFSSKIQGRRLEKFLENLYK